MINPLSTSVSGLMAAARKATVAASNIANADVIGSTDPNSPDQAYSARVTQDTSTAGGGVQTSVLTRNSPFVPSYSPDSPLADAQGVVNAPNVNLDEELITLKQAENAYKANSLVSKLTKELLDIV